MVDKKLLYAVRTIVTHENCPDGLASAMILKHALPSAEVVFLQHGSPEMAAFEPSPGQLWCDVCPPPDKAEAFFEAGAIVLDHHKAAEKTVRAFGDSGVFADEKLEPGVSGAVLAWREVFLPVCGRVANVARFACLAGIRDTWMRDSELWEEACAQAEALVFFGPNLIEGRPWLVHHEMEVGRQLMAKRLADARKTAERALVMGRVAVVNERYVSDVAEALRETGSGASLAVGFTYVGQTDGTTSLIFSLRSLSDDVDAAHIAVSNGGGGHTKAAGFSVRDIGSQTPYDGPYSAVTSCLMRAGRGDLLREV